VRICFTIVLWTGCSLLPQSLIAFSKVFRFLKTILSQLVSCNHYWLSSVSHTKFALKLCSIRCEFYLNTLNNKYMYEFCTYFEVYVIQYAWISVPQYRQDFSFLLVLMNWRLLLVFSAATQELISSMFCYYFAVLTFTNRHLLFLALCFWWVLLNYVISCNIFSSNRLHHVGLEEGEY